MTVNVGTSGWSYDHWTDVIYPPGLPPTQRLPLEESRESLNSWYRYLYYGLLIYSALLGGTLISIILMLYNAAHDLITIVHPHKDHDHLILSEERA